MASHVIDSEETLRDLYGEPAQLSVDKQLQQLDKYSKQFLSLSPFALLSTANSQGRQDCSPRGDQPGFVQVLDDNTIAMPDRPGNRRLDSLTNIVNNPYVGLLIMVPGFKECLRINGEAKISVEPELISRFEVKGKLPKTVIVITVAEVYFHCSKAIVRSQLWSSEAQCERGLMPSFGKMLVDQAKLSVTEAEMEQVEAYIADRAKNELY